MRAARHPLIVGLERQSKPVVGNAHIAVRAARYRVRRHGPHLLRHYPDKGGVAAVVDEAIIAETVVEPPEQYDVMLEAHVGATPAAATPAAATPAVRRARRRRSRRRARRRRSRRRVHRRRPRHARRRSRPAFRRG